MDYKKIQKLEEKYLDYKAIYGENNIVFKDDNEGGNINGEIQESGNLFQKMDTLGSFITH